MTKPEGTREYENSFWMDGETWLVREARFGEAVIDFAKTIPQGPTTDRVISQVIGAATSVGANYVEADDSVSKKEFSSALAPARRRRVKRNIFCACRFAQFLS